MQDSKLLKILRTLSVEDSKYLRWFIQSNFFNTDANLLRLFEALSKYYPDFSSKSLTKESVFEKVFNGLAFNDAKWRNLLSKMNKLVEDYIIWLELEQDEGARTKLLTVAYGRRNLYQHFEKSTFDLLEKLEHQSEKSADALRERMLVNLQYYHHPLTSKVDNLDKLQSAMDELDHYYFSEKLRLACDLKVFENMVAGAAPIRLKQEITASVRGEGVQRFDYLENYAMVLELLDQPPKMENFQVALDFFSRNAEKLSGADRQFGLLHLLNFTINQTNKGEQEYRPHLLKLYKMGLEQAVLITDGKISDNTFINIVFTASGLKEFEWTKQFILKHENLLSPETRKETTALSLGNLYFNQNNYALVIDILNFPFQNFNTLLPSKNLLFRCYFELFLLDDSYYSLFISFATAFDKFVKREKQLSLERKGWYKNLINSMTSIVKHKYRYTWNGAMKARAIDEIASKPMYLKAWLLDRIKNL